ncbi:MAG: ABC transporter permease [Spirochaetia bacterium]|jgi:simple sugar transport system permease protein|nr:ABC transporter permease [Spirochaetia bacterium]
MRQKSNPGRLLKKPDLDALLASDAWMSVFVVILGFLCGTLIVLAVGRNPLNMFAALLQSMTGWDATRYVWNIRYVGEWLAISTPLILCGLSMGFAARAGLFNIGAEGQYMIGLTIAQFVALFFPQILGLHVGVAVLLAAVGGAAWGGIVGWLKARFNASEVVATIMLNYVAFFLSRWATMLIPGANTYRTPNLPQSAQLDIGFLSKLTNGSTMNAGFFIAIASVVVFWYIMERTRLGFALRATGLNKDAALASGINAGRSAVTSMAVAGAFAGMAGAVVALGSFNFGRVLAGFDNYGFSGIAVALVGNSTGPGIALSGLLFGLLASAQPLMQSRGIPKEITLIISGLVVVFVSLRAGVRLVLAWRKKSALVAAALTDGTGGRVNGAKEGGDA